MFKKRTKLLGATSKQALSILDDLCQEKFQRKLSPGVHDAALICYKCRMKVEGLPDLYKKAEAARGDLLELIENVLRGCENLPQPQDIQSDTDTQCTAEELDEEELLPPSAKSRRRDSVDLLEHNDTSCTPVSAYNFVYCILLDHNRFASQFRFVLENKPLLSLPHGLNRMLKDWLVKTLVR
jgi:hypothetical protein